MRSQLGHTLLPPLYPPRLISDPVYAQPHILPSPDAWGGGHLCWREVIPDLLSNWSRHKNNPLSPVILTPLSSSLFASLIQYQQNRGCQGAVPACVGTSASWSNSGVTETDDCVKAASPEGSQSSSPPKPSTLQALLSHVPYCNDLMLIQDQRPRASIYIKTQETGTPPEPVGCSARLYLCTWGASRLCGCMPSKSWVILLSHFWVFLQRISKWEVDFRKCEGPPGWCVNAQLTVLPVGCSKPDRSWVKVLILILLWISSVGVVWMTSSVIGNFTWLIVSFWAEKWKTILVKYSSWITSHRRKKNT